MPRYVLSYFPLCCELKKTRSIGYSQHNNSTTMYQGSYDSQLIRLRWISLTYEPYTRNREKRHRYREPYYEITCQPICPANVYLHNVSQIRAIVIRLFTTACLIGHSMHLPLSLLFPGYTYMREFGISRTDDRTRCAVAPGVSLRNYPTISLREDNRVGGSQFSNV